MRSYAVSLPCPRPPGVCRPWPGLVQPPTSNGKPFGYTAEGLFTRGVDAAGFFK